MARVPRKFTVTPGFSVHKIWRGHNKEWNLASSEQKARYLHFMNEDLESEKYQAGSSVEALTLMSSHSHEVSRITDQSLFSNHMRRHHARYGRYFNDTQNRCGKVAQDRPHTTLIGDDHHRMLCTFYIHANPHRANIGDADNYEYSTHKLYSQGKRSPWMRNIVFPEWYMKLGENMAQRQRKYRQLFALYLKTTGRQKQTFLKRRFLGPVIWMHENEKRVTDWRGSRKEAPS